MKHFFLKISKNKKKYFFLTSKLQIRFIFKSKPKQLKIKPILLFQTKQKYDPHFADEISARFQWSEREKKRF